MIIKKILTRYLFLTVALILFILPFVGCSSMLNGKTQTISVNSNPSGARVTFNGLTIGITPIGTLVEKRSSGTLVVEKEGFQTQTIPVETGLTGAFWGNLIWGYFFPFSSTTDLAGGTAYEYSPDSFFIELVPEGASQLEIETYLAEAQLRKFILFNHRQIIRDSSIEQGEYLDALSELLSVKTEEQKVDFAAQLLKLHEDNSTSPEFAERIVMLFKTRPLKIKAVADFR